MKLENRRRLTLEGLEGRRCFAVDIAGLLASLDIPENVAEIVRHNYDQPTDVNVDGETSPVDALNVINELNLKSGVVNTAMMVDTNGDRLVSPIDALIVINHLNDRSNGSTEDVMKDISSEPTTEADNAAADLIKQTILESQMAGDSIAALLSRLQDAGIVDLGSFDLGSYNLEWLGDDWRDSVDLAAAGLTSADLPTLDLPFGDSGSIDFDLSDLGGQSSPAIGRTYDPTDDNGNGFFLVGEDAEPLRTLIDEELRKQLILGENASIQVAVFTGGGEVTSGTWRYLTKEGIGIWGNWRKTPDELRLFLSNVEEENRIYGQYPDGSFLYFSWLDQEPVGFYFSPIGKDGVESPVPTERYDDYFDTIPGSDATEIGGFVAFAGDLGAFNGVLPIESLLSDLFAIQRKWNDELAASGA